MEFALDAYSIFAIVFLFLAIVIVAMGVKSVSQGYEYTIERFGRYTRTLSPGLHLIVPVVDRIGAQMNMMETVLDVPSQEVITQDNAVVQVDGVVFFQVLDAAKAAYEVRNLERAILNLDHDQHPYGHGLDGPRRAAVRARPDQRPPAVHRRRRHRALGRQGHPHRDQGHHAAARPGRVHGPADEGRTREARRHPRGRGQPAGRDPARRGREAGPILAAEGRREAAFRDAEAREREAEAEAKATTMVSEAIARGDVQAINYFVAQRYVDALGQVRHLAQPEDPSSCRWRPPA